MNYCLDISDDAEKELEYFIKSGNISALKKIYSLFEELKLHPREGTGKPKQLTGDLAGYWSRRIDSKNRMIYKIVDNVVIVEVLSLREHYLDK